MNINEGECRIIYHLTPTISRPGSLIRFKLILGTDSNGFRPDK